MTPVTSCQRPSLPAGLEVVVDPFVDDDELWEDMDVSGQLSPADIAGLEIQSSRLTAVILTGLVLERARWRNTLISSSELSGAILEAAGLNRVEFVDCRITGAAFTTARLQNVRFHRCRMDQALFRMATMEHVEFDECDLRGADFYNARLPGAVIHDCNLEGADFSGASMVGARLHGSNVADLIGSRSLAGVEIDSSQITPMALNVFGALGIKIADPDDDS